MTEPTALDQIREAIASRSAEPRDQIVHIELHPLDFQRMLKGVPRVVARVNSLFGVPVTPSPLQREGKARMIFADGTDRDVNCPLDWSGAS